MTDTIRYDVVVVGGGLAGLSAAIQLSEKGYRTLLIEKNYYPFHRVCGEYISEESRPFLEKLGIPISSLPIPKIGRLLVSAPDGTSLTNPLVPGGFGISRYWLDSLLASQAKSVGVTIWEGMKVQQVNYENGWMQVRLSGAVIQSKLVLGCFGKRSSLDVKMNRSFVREKPGKLNNFLGVKYHIEWEGPEDLIALHNFKGGYCGISRIENNQHCLCYLTNANNLGMSNNSIIQMEQTILSRNPYLDRIFRDARKIRQEPVSISQISFASKEQVEEHLLLVGDAAGLISPLCGNGMSMALHGSYLAVKSAIPFLEGSCSRQQMEQEYAKLWKQQFSGRLRSGRIIQSFFGDPWLSKGLIFAGNKFPTFTNWLIGRTHGETFV